MPQQAPPLEPLGLGAGVVLLTLRLPGRTLTSVHPLSPGFPGLWDVAGIRGASRLGACPGANRALWGSVGGARPRE